MNHISPATSKPETYATFSVLTRTSRCLALAAAVTGLMALTLGGFILFMTSRMLLDGPYVSIWHAVVGGVVLTVAGAGLIGFSLRTLAVGDAAASGNLTLLAANAQRGVNISMFPIPPTPGDPKPFTPKVVS